MNSHKLRSKFLQLVSLFSVLCFLFSIVGCEAFIRKFTRKKKKSATNEELVLAPKEYSASDIPIEQRYREYFLLWKSWHDELIVALDSSVLQKKKRQCLEEAIRNLVNLRLFLVEEKQKQLDDYLAKLSQLQDEILKDTYGRKAAVFKSRTETLRRGISRDFAFSKVSEDIDYGVLSE